jgi:N4-gp56 family major capsid protein
MALPAPAGGAITSSATISAANTSGYSTPGTGGTGLTAGIQQIWSKEILFQAMPVLRFEQFAVKKTELGVQPGLTINFMRYNNISASAGAILTEGTRMEPVSLTANQITITVGERGKAVAVTELLLNASFDDVMASSSRLLGRHMAQTMDLEARGALYAGCALFGAATSASVPPNVIFGRGTLGATRGSLAPYDAGLLSASGGLTSASLGASVSGGASFTTTGSAAGVGYMSPATVKDAVQILAQANIPRIGDTYVCFVNPAQSRSLRDWPEFIEVTKYAAPGNFMLGEIGRIYDVVFIETTQIEANSKIGGASVGIGAGVYGGIMIGDNAFGHAISLPVELRDGGVIDFGREHGLAWYSIWGFAPITHESRVIIATGGGSIGAL